MSTVMGFSLGCMSEEPQPRRRRIDRSMIGAPTNFVHAGHIGTGDTSQLSQVKDQMSSKGDTNTAAVETTSTVVSNALSLEDAQKQFGAKPVTASS
eukprot:m.113379 g.113379  ORF g.113379 m.113379 type:complete len:96 (-) comp15356_c5_seq1:32-319(-)